MSKFQQPCPHTTADHSSLLDIKQIDSLNSCADCDYAGPNLWICLHRKCMHVGCSEQANDHSTEHFQRSKNNQLHCIHMNLSSQRAWCYFCEREVFLEGVSATQVLDPITKQVHYSDDDNDSDSAVNMPGMGLVGLQNIANTCYMNAALQALSNVLPMTHYFLNCSDLVDHSLEQSAHRCKAGLARSYQRLIRDMWCKRDDGKGHIAPRSILYGIRSVHPMFRGFQQHDTQEFLRCFMDQLHEELKEQSSSSTTSYGSSPPPGSFVEKVQHDNATHEEDNISECSSQCGSSTSISETEYATCDSTISEHSGECGEQFTTSCVRPNLPGSHSSTLGTNVSSTGQMSSTTVTRSIVSDVFDGKLLSSVQCLTCDRISTREETFQDLSLPIPNRDFLTVLHQANSVSVQSLNSIDSTSSRVNDSWLSWIWNLVRSWLWGPSVTLHDCMASFFSADELKGDNMYSCEKCNKLRTGVKYSRVLDLPEVLCIHLKRFRHDLSYSSKISAHVHFPLEGFDMRPYLHKDCKSQIALYNLSSVICHHGTVGGGHYTCFARNALTDRWYEFDDQHVSEVTADIVQNCQAYVLFYHKHNPQMELLRVEASELAALYPVHQADIRFYVSREWLARFNTFGEPGPISNWSMLCPHGGVIQSKTDLLARLAIPISQPLWDFLYNKFGGGPPINMLFECEICKRGAENLARRQYYEHSVFLRYNGLDAELDSGAIYAVSMSWLRKWQQFARGITSKEPGPITNASIVANVDGMQKSSPVRSVRLGSDYVQLNAPLWRFLHDIYGGGPEVLLRPSLTEEIEIIDQDDLDENSGYGNGNLSDTESNLGRNNTLEPPKLLPLRKDIQQVALDEQCVVNDEPLQKPVLKSPHAQTREHKQLNKHFAVSAKRPLKPLAFHSSFRKRVKKGRNVMRNSELFGASGNYNKLQKESYTALTNTLRSEPHSTDENFIKVDARQSNNYQTFSSENRISKETAESIKDFKNAEVAIIKTKTKSKDPVVLQKFVYLRESSDSTEADI